MLHGLIYLSQFYYIGSIIYSKVYLSSVKAVNTNICHHNWTSFCFVIEWGWQRSIGGICFW